METINRGFPFGFIRFTILNKCRIITVLIVLNLLTVLEGQRESKQSPLNLIMLPQS